MKPSSFAFVLGIGLALEMFPQKLEWAKVANAKTIDLDADRMGNVVVAGEFQDTLTFGATTFTGTGLFIAKLDPAGNAIWAQRIPAQLRMTALAAGRDDEVIVTGWFTAASVTIGAYTLKNAGGNNPGSTQGPGPPCTDVFVVRLGPDGCVRWVASGGGTGNDYGRAVAVDDAGNIVVCGEIESVDAQFGNFPASTQNREVFAVKYNNAGVPAWLTELDGEDVKDVAIDKHGFVSIAGQLGRFNHPKPDHRVFLTRLDPWGKVNWEATAESGFAITGTGVCVDEKGRTTVAGLVSKHSSIRSGAVDLPAGEGTAFILQVDSTGEGVWGMRSSGVADVFDDLSMDNNGNIYAIGGFAGEQFSIGEVTLPRPQGSAHPKFLLRMSGDGQVFCGAALRHGDGRRSVTPDYRGGAYFGGDFGNGPFILAGSAVTFTENQRVYSFKATCELLSLTTSSGRNANRLIYPNPAESELFIDLREDALVQISGTDGKLLKSMNLAKGTRNICLPESCSGIYLIEIIYAGAVEIHKLIIE